MKQKRLEENEVAFEYTYIYIHTYTILLIFLQTCEFIYIGKKKEVDEHEPTTIVFIDCHHTRCSLSPFFLLQGTKQAQVLSLFFSFFLSFLLTPYE